MNPAEAAHGPGRGSGMCLRSAPEIKAGLLCIATAPPQLRTRPSQRFPALGFLSSGVWESPPCSQLLRNSGASVSSSLRSKRSREAAFILSVSLT